METVKKWIQHWTKFKGKLARVWFRKVEYESVMRACIASRRPSKLVLKRTERGFAIEKKPIKLRKVEIIESIEGKISDIVENPFGIILDDVKMWQLVKEPEGKELGEFVAETESDVKGVFIPISLIVRVDFLDTKKKHGK